MKRTFIAAAVVAAIVAGAQPASAGPPAWRDREKNVKACPSNWWKSHSREAVRQLVICEAELFNVSVSHALYVADRESKFYWKAFNSSGCGGAGCGGIYQHHMAYWSGRVNDYARDFKPSWTNARTQCVVTFKMVRQGGWGPWGG